MVLVLETLGPGYHSRNYGDGAKNLRLSNCSIESLSGLGKVLTNLQKHKIIIRFVDVSNHLLRSN